MSKLKLLGSTSGHTMLSAPASAGSNTLVLPPNNGTSGQILQTDGNGNLTWANPPNNTPAFEVYMSANLTGMGNDADVKLPFNTEYFDTDNAWDTSNYKFTVPAGKGGKYFIGANAYNATGSGFNYTRLQIWKNGSTFGYNYASSGVTSHSLSNNINRIITLADGDYIEFYNAQSNGGQITYTSNNTHRTVGYGWRLIGI